MDDLTEIQVDLIRNRLYLDAAAYLLGLNSLTFCTKMFLKAFFVAERLW
jgi:hypothetical protein